MNYSKAREYVENAAKKGSILGLLNMERLMYELGDVQNKIKILHIAGTNGKGSTLAYISEILKQAGYKVGKYTSPAVFDYREIFSINGESISEKMYGECMEQIAKAIDEMTKKGFESPTAFEIETALAFLYFYKEECDIALIEVGMGGDMDATNVVTNTLLSVITPISLDHMQFLGESIEEIAGHKSGIIKNSSAVVIANQTEEAIKVITKKAKEMSAEVIVCGKPENIRYMSDKTEFDYEISDKMKRDYELSDRLETRDFEFIMLDVTTNMLGDFQPENAVTAIEAVNYLIKKGFIVKKEDIYAGIRQAKWNGRFEKICDNPPVYFDGGHNPAAAMHIKKSLEIYFTNKKIVYIIGVLADKDYDSVLKITGGLADKIITITPDNPRALSKENLRDTAKKYNNDVVCADTVSQAIDMAYEYLNTIDNFVNKESECENVQKESDINKIKINEIKDGVIVVFGSLSYLGEIRKTVSKKCPDRAR